MVPVYLELCPTVDHFWLYFRPAYWWFQTDITQCVLPTTLKDNSNSTCNFFFSVCRPVPLICQADSAACSFPGKITADSLRISDWPRNFGLQSTYDFTVVGKTKQYLINFFTLQVNTELHWTKKKRLQ